MSSNYDKFTYQYLLFNGRGTEKESKPRMGKMLYSYNFKKNNM